MSFFTHIETIISEVRDIEGISGIHVMAFRQEKLVADIISDNGLLPRPIRKGGPPVINIKADGAK